jgi:MtN3 and saliva related transmembrane protein
MRRYGFILPADGAISFRRNGSLCSESKGTRVESAWINLVGALAAMLTTSAFFPQAVKTIRTRDTSGLSLTMYALLLSGVTLWLAYGVIIGSWPLIVSNAVVLLPQGLVMAILLRQQWRSDRPLASASRSNPVAVPLRSPIPEARAR